MNQYLVDNDYVLLDFNADRAPQIRTLFSRYDQYSLYIGANRTEDRNNNTIYYAKIYLRADTRKTNIKRRYQKFMEFYADASSLLLAIYEILVVIFNYVDTFYGYNTISKKIFFFKDLENSDSFNINKKINVINELITITDLKKTSEKSLYKSESRDSKSSKNAPPRKIQISAKKEPEKENKDTKNFAKKNDSRISSLSKGKMTEERKLNKKIERNIYNNEKYFEGEEDIVNYPRYKLNQKERNKNSRAILNFRYANKPESEFSESIGTNMEDFYSSYSEQNEKRRKGKRKLKVENSFNIFEIIITQFLK